MCIDLGNQNNNRDIFSCWISKFAYEFPCILIKYGYLFAGTCISWCFIRIIFDINVDKRDKYMNRSIFAIFFMFFMFSSTCLFFTLNFLSNISSTTMFACWFELDLRTPLVAFFHHYLPSFFLFLFFVYWTIIQSNTRER